MLIFQYSGQVSHNQVSQKKDPDAGQKQGFDQKFFEGSNSRIKDIGMITKNVPHVQMAGFGFGLMDVVSLKNISYVLLGLYAARLAKRVFMPPDISKSVMPSYVEAYKQEMDRLVQDAVFDNKGNKEFGKEIDGLLRMKAVKDTGGGPKFFERYTELKNEFIMRVQAGMVLPETELVNEATGLLGPGVFNDKFIKEISKTREVGSWLYNPFMPPEGPKWTTWLKALKEGYYEGLPAWNKWFLPKWHEPLVRHEIRRTHVVDVKDGYYGAKMPDAIQNACRDMGLVDEATASKAVIANYDGAKEYMVSQTMASENKIVGEMYTNAARSQTWKDIKAFFGVARKEDGDGPKKHGKWKFGPRTLPQQYNKIIDEALRKAGFWEAMQVGSSADGKMSGGFSLEKLKRIQNGEDWRTVLNAYEKRRVAKISAGFFNSMKMGIREMFGKDVSASDLPGKIIDKAVEKSGTGFRQGFWEKHRGVIGEEKYAKIIGGSDYKGVLSFEETAKIADLEASVLDRFTPRYSLPGKMLKAGAWIGGAAILFFALSPGIFSPPRQETPQYQKVKRFTRLTGLQEIYYDQWNRQYGNKREEGDFLDAFDNWAKGKGIASPEHSEKYEDYLKQFVKENTPK